jgi:hypothetical protein
MKGDRVEIVIDVGNGTRIYEITARRAGRRVEVARVRGMIEVSEVARTGTVIRTGRFMGSRVVAVIEHPVDIEERPVRRRRAKDQPSLL